MFYIYKCSYEGNKSLPIRINFNRNIQYLEPTHSVTLSDYRGNYISNCIDDFKLNWLDQLSENEIDNILERFIEEKILILYSIFVPTIKKDKIELIKSSLNIQRYKYRYYNDNEPFQPYITYSAGFVTNLDKDENIKHNDKKKKEFACHCSDKIIDLLRKAHSSREYRKNESVTKKIAPLN